MILPSNERCVQVMKELRNEDTLSEFEYEFVTSNLRREFFTDRQKEIVLKLIDKYEV